ASISWAVVRDAAGVSATSPATTRCPFTTIVGNCVSPSAATLSCAHAGDVEKAATPVQARRRDLVVRKVMAFLSRSGRATSPARESTPLGSGSVTDNDGRQSLPWFRHLKNMILFVNIKHDKKSQIYCRYLPGAAIFLDEVYRMALSDCQMYY